MIWGRTDYDDGDGGDDGDDGDGGDGDLLLLILRYEGLPPVGVQTVDGHQTPPRLLPDRPHLHGPGLLLPQARPLGRRGGGDERGGGGGQRQPDQPPAGGGSDQPGGNCPGEVLR